MMRECQMQVSGPWPPYHFVHRLTRGAHVAAQPAAARVAAPVASTLISMPNAIPAMA
jgi:hypothetical protein